MSESLTALDATFLELEQADLGAHMHIGGVMVFDPLPEGGVPGLDELRAVLDRRLHVLPRYRQRLSEPRVAGLRWPRWIEVDSFDISHHVRRAMLPNPGGRAELAEWAADFSQRLDRAIPLWEFVLLEGLEGGRWALATKTHHAMVDGVGSVDVSYLMLDSDPNAVDDEPAPGSPTPEAAAGTGTNAGPEAGATSGLGALPGRAVSMLAGGARLGMRGAALPVKAARSAAGLLRPAPAREAMERARAAIELVVRDEILAAPATSINRPIGAHRRLALDRFPLADLKAIKTELGGTVNDVVLSATAAGLRELLLSRGEAPPEQGLRAMVPVNIRAVGEHGDLGNKVSSLFVDLAVTEEQPLARYRRQMEAAEALKSGRQALGSTTVVAVGSLAPPALHSFVAHALFGTRLFNVTITNVPGPQMPLYASGARMREVWPLVPIAADHAVGLAVISYDGEMFFCLNVDRDSTEDVGVLAAGIRSEIEALMALPRGSGDVAEVR